MRVITKVQKPRVRPTHLLVNAFGDDRRPGSLLLQVRRKLRRIGEEMAQEMRNSIYQDRFLKAPLSPAYAARKEKLGLDPRILIAYKKYVKNIAFIRTPYGGIVGLRATTRRDPKRKPIPYHLLQRWLEYGTRKRLPSGKKGKIGSKMPARPHWRPMIRSWKARRREFLARIRRSAGFELRKLIREHART